MKILLTRKLLFLMVCFFVVPAHAQDSRWSFLAGVSLKEVSLDVYRKGSSDSLGTLVSDYLILPEFVVERGITYFPDSAAGYKYVFGFGGFSMDKQEVDAENVDLGTSARGYYFYAMPVIAYDFFKAKHAQSLLFGLGFGVGYMNVKGDLILTETDLQTRHEFDFSEFNYSSGLFFEYALESWSLSFNLYGPSASDGDYEYDVYDFNITWRKRFTG